MCTSEIAIRSKDSYMLSCNHWAHIKCVIAVNPNTNSHIYVSCRSCLLRIKESDRSNCLRKP